MKEATALIEASTEIDATPEAVWSVVSDLKRMGEWSPQCRKMIVRGGPVGLGTRTINVNRRGPLFWPTTAKVIRFDPNEAIAWKVAENGSVWSYEIAPTASGVTLTERREAPGGKVSNVSGVLTQLLLGGRETFEAELREGMAESLAKIKRAAQAVAT
ncbi:SRPBCC family protein [Gordonia sp. X0973]|uniref:SRPBCC family protein n=1 Tax=Gordonia sp. X0973 TaxID=2742602 RepID=UPI000F545C84|nr:SRPBCC family protein [Gordonia sp. X0973]QKT06139.1 SRPBCC family protein [Gordonia sp. X0973]